MGKANPLTGTSRYSPQSSTKLNPGLNGKQPPDRGRIRVPVSTRSNDNALVAISAAKQRKKTHYDLLELYTVGPPHSAGY